MDNIFYAVMATEKFFYIMISFSFVIGIILMTSSDAFLALDRALRKEYGLKRKIFPKFECLNFEPIDKFTMKNRIYVGLVISVVSFVMLLIHG